MYIVCLNKFTVLFYEFLFTLFIVLFNLYFTR